MAFGRDIFPFMYNHLDGKTLDKPVYSDWVNAMQKYHPDYTGQPDTDVERIYTKFSKEEAMLAAEDLCLAAGVRLVYHHHLFDVVKKDGKITTAILFSKSGLTAAQAEVFIDCTGDGDLAVQAGCEYAYGNENGFCQPMTLCFKLSGVEVDRMPSRAEINALYDRAKEGGEIQCPRENVLLFATPQKDIIHFNTTRIIKKMQK